ncbi:MAG: response regulator [Candidatus Brocadiaceae bacterium]|nr:response regulator [Candidatus Brocadiaceae bacterium]
MPAARILIIEDERQTVDSLRDLFEQHGFETEVALNRHVALSILQERSMDIAIVSTMIQDVSGLEILEEIKKQCADLPVIMISDQKSKRLEISSLKAGASVFLVKPLDNSFVLRTIEKLFEARYAAVVTNKRGARPKPKK